MNMVKKILFQLLISCLLLGNVTTAYAAKIYSVDINNVDKKETIECMVNELISHGFNIVTTNDYMIVCRKDVDDFMARVLYGSRFNSTPESRMTINFAQIGNNVKATAEFRVVTNPNSAFERSQVIENKDIQQMLDRFKIYMEQNHTKTKFVVAGFVVKADSRDENGYLIVKNVMPNGNAFKAGLRQGDIILQINNKSVISMSDTDIASELKGTLGTKISLHFKSPDSPEKKTITFEKTEI